MKTVKIFLKQKEIETLCFSKIIQLPEKQTEITKAKKFYAHAVLIPEEQIIKYQNSIILLFSSVIKIEIPESEFNLFKNQIRVPVGLITTVKRKIYEDDNNSYFIETDSSINLDQFVPFRRGLLQLLIYGYKKPSMQNHIEVFIRNIVHIHSFSKLFLKTVTDEKEYPQIVYKNDDYLNPSHFMWAWWGKYIIDNLLLSSGPDIKDSELVKHKEWLKSFDLEDLKKNLNHLENPPKILQEHLSLLAGYFFASQIQTNTRVIDRGNDILEVLNSDKGLEKRYDILFWGIFFQSLFNTEIEKVYPNPKIQNSFYKIETIALDLSRVVSNQKIENIDSTENLFNKINEKELLLKYYELKNGKFKKRPEILFQEDIFKPFFDTPLSKKNQKYIGLINLEYENSLHIKNGSFYIEGKLSDKVMVYYGNLTSKQKNELKNSGVNIKIKPLNSLVLQNKKVLVAFFSEMSGNNKIENIYRELLKNKTNIKELIVVWLVSAENNYLHSTEFALKKNQYLRYLQDLYGIKTTIIVNNINDTDMGKAEVKRNLKLALKNYKVNEIEVINNDNFNENHANWLIDATRDYVIKRKEMNYYFLEE